MNCTVCGNPLLFDRVAFHCSCGAFVHSYCWDEHVLQAHRPAFETGGVNLDGEFVPRESKVEAVVADEQLLETQVSEVEETEEEISEVEAVDEEDSKSDVPEPVDSEQQASEEQTAEEQASEEESPEKQTTPLVE